MANIGHIVPVCKHTIEWRSVVGAYCTEDRCLRCKKIFCYDCIMEKNVNADTICPEAVKCISCFNPFYLDHFNASRYIGETPFFCRQCRYLVEATEQPEKGWCGYRDCKNTFRICNLPPKQEQQRTCTICYTMPCMLHRETGITINGKWYCYRCADSVMRNKSFF